MPEKALLIGDPANPRVAYLQQELARLDLIAQAADWETVTRDGLDAETIAILLLMGAEDSPEHRVLQLQALQAEESIPALVVAPLATPEQRRACAAAGASLICSIDDRNDRIAAEFRALVSVCRCGLNRDSVELLQPFVAATEEAAETMAGIRSHVHQILRKRGFRMPGDVSGLITLLGNTERLMAITFPMASAKALTVRVLGEIVGDPGLEMIFDYVGELASIVAGQVKGRFVHTDYEFEISTPSVVYGVQHEIHYKSDLPAYTIEFGSDVGDFVVQLCVREHDREVTR